MPGVLIEPAPEIVPRDRHVQEHFYQTSTDPISRIPPRAKRPKDICPTLPLFGRIGRRPRRPWKAGDLTERCGTQLQRRVWFGNPKLRL